MLQLPDATISILIFQETPATYAMLEDETIQLSPLGNEIYCNAKMSHCFVFRHGVRRRGLLFDIVILLILTLLDVALDLFDNCNCTIWS